MRHQHSEEGSHSNNGKMISNQSPMENNLFSLKERSKDSKKSEESNIVLKREDVSLPQEFRVKYLGQKNATGLWGIKHTRKPVDEMVSEVKKSSKSRILPILGLNVSEKGVEICDVSQSNSQGLNNYYPLEVISYGVQDLMYTRVFAMIVVIEAAKKDPSVHPFQCHAFVCDSKANARRLTFALAEAFQIFSRKMKTVKPLQPQKFAIDLRAAQDIENDLDMEDSEA